MDDGTCFANYNVSFGSGRRVAIRKHDRLLPCVMLLNGRPKSRRPKLRKGYKPPRLTRQLKWALEDLEELVVKKKLSYAYQKFVDITKLDIVPEMKQYHEMILLMGLISVEDAEQVIEDMRRKEVPVGISAMNEIIKVHGRRRDSEGIRMTLERIDNMGLAADGHTIWAMVEAFVRAGDVEGGRFALEQMKQRKLMNQKGSFLARMRFYSFIGDVDSVEEAFFEMTEIYGYFPICYAYNLRIATFAEKREVVAALETIEEMKLAKLKPNELTYSVVIKMYVAMGKVEAAKELFSKMRREGIKPKENTFASITKGVRYEQRRVEIVDALREMNRNLDRPVGFLNSFSSLVNLFTARQSEVISTQIALKSMLQYDVDPEHAVYLSVFSPATSDGKLCSPTLACERMAGSGVRLDAMFYTGLFDAYHRLGEPQYALLTLEMMEESGIGITTGMISVVAGSYCRRGKSSIALKWVSLLLRNKILPSSKAFAYIATSYFSALDERTSATIVSLMAKYSIPWHPRQKRALYRARQRDNSFLSGLGVPFVNAGDDIVEDTLCGRDYTLGIMVQDDRAQLDRSSLDEAQREALNELETAEDIDMSQNLILSKLTDMALEHRDSIASGGGNRMFPRQVSDSDILETIREFEELSA
mmetsp:Transcript_43718/g.171073  ORF Transcript_43718/g.171073 Transcript_43718/m.171073 type:complete len:646 (-) Transcript_43718:2256-4193(-)